MKDQVDAACENGLHAAFINSSLSSQEYSNVLRRFRSGSLELLYLAPERFAMAGFLDVLKAVPLSLFAIDEAHCISEWGHDFRPDYLGLSRIAETFPGVPVAAFTATATHKVQQDIIGRLGLRNPFLVRASFNRPNLFYEVYYKENLEQQILEFLKTRTGQSGIIYRATRDSVDALAGTLSSKGISSLAYHAGLSPQERTRTQNAFSKDEAQIIVATIAFGMGIDKSDIRFVIHGDLPRSMENYYQETGRAGRDGEPGHCLLLYGKGDIPKIKYFIERMEDPDEKAIAYDKLDHMVRYASHHACRRKKMLEWFGEHFPEDNCASCDICTGRAEKVDITVDAQKFMSAVSRTGQNFGISHIIDIVAGAATKRIKELGHDRIKTYGAGKDKNKKYWSFLAGELIAQEALNRIGEPYPVLKLTDKGKDILFGRASITALKKEESVPVHQECGPMDDSLFERLREVRKKLAQEHEVPPYIIFSDAVLKQMATALPQTLEDMARISGIGQYKLDHYCSFFLDAIGTYGRKTSTTEDKARQEPPKTPGAKPKLNATATQTLKLFRAGLSIAEIAQERSLSERSIINHLAQAISCASGLDLERLVEGSKRQDIEAAFIALGTSFLKPVVEHFDGAVSYEEATIVRALLIQKGLILTENPENGS